MNPLLFALLTGAAPAAAPVESVTVRDTITQRARPIEYSDWYARRLTIHRIGSFVEFPLFAAQYTVGQRLINSDSPSGGLRGTHQALAAATAVLFGVNTVTGLWNLYDSRRDPAGRARRITHSVLMLAADAGFLLTAGLAGESEGGEGFERGEQDDASRHRQVAIGSMAISAAGTLMMWLWKER